MAFIMVVIYVLPLLTQCDLEINFFTSVVITGLLWTITLMRIHKSFICFCIASIMLGLSCYLFFSCRRFKQMHEHDILTNVQHATHLYNTRMEELSLISVYMVLLFFMYIMAATFTNRMSKRESFLQ